MKRKLGPLSFSAGRRARLLPLVTRFLWTCAVVFACGGEFSAAQELDPNRARAAIFADTGTGHQQGPVTGNVHVNEVLGADRFYDAGFTGANAVMANIEAGRIWNHHETLFHVQQIPSFGAIGGGEFDRHATWVGMVMGGRQGGFDPGDYQVGIAPDAALFSGAIASGWASAGNPSRWSASFFSNPSSIMFNTYARAFNVGLIGSRTADVINSSYNGFDGGDADGNGIRAMGLDGLTNTNPRTLLTLSAGNGGVGTDKVTSPASGYNALVVGALSESSDFEEPALFTSGGLSDYSDPTNGTVQAARWRVDMAAPGTAIASAYYGGETGGNRASLGGEPGGPAGGPDWYSRFVQGTSFSAPMVAGGAALLYDAAYSLLAGDDDARDARVMKAVLMNSADKTTGWNNGQVAHPNGNGGVLTTQALDERVGTGRLNLDRAFDQYLSGTTDVAGTGAGDLGMVDPLGWDFGIVAEGTPNDYLIERPLEGGSTFTATLSWFRDRRMISTSATADDSYDNLDLELWRVTGDSLFDLIAESSSTFNSSEHFSFEIPTTDDYLLRVRWTGEHFDRVSDENAEQYGVAWFGTAVPEPASVVLLVLAIGALAVGRRRR